MIRVPHVKPDTAAVTWYARGMHVVPLWLASKYARHVTATCSITTERVAQRQTVVVPTCFGNSLSFTLIKPASGSTRFMYAYCPVKVSRAV